MLSEYPYPRPHRLDLDDIKISITHESYTTALQTVDYYHRQAMTMTPDEQQKYVDMVRSSDYILSPSNRTTPSNNKVWKYLKDPVNADCRAHFVMLAAAYGISKLSHLRENVEGAGDVFEIMDYSEHYDHFYHISTPSPTEERLASVDEPPSTGDFISSRRSSC